MAIMSYENWYQLTYERFNWRGSELTAVDEAIKAYHARPDQPRLQSLLRSLTKYIAYLGSLQGASRNEKGGITKLRDEVHDLLYGLITPETEALRKLMDEHRQQALTRLFHNRKVILKRNEKVKAAMTVASTGSALYSGISQAIKQEAQRKASEILQSIVTTVAPGKASEIMGWLGANYILQFANAILPFMGTFTSGAKAIAKLYTALDSAYTRHKVQTVHKSYVTPGDAGQAVDALAVLLQQRAADAGKRAGIFASGAVIKGVSEAFGAGAIAGPLAGIGEAAAIIALDVYMAAKEYKEVGLANGILLLPPGQLAGASRIFSAYPLIGAYFITYCTPNDIVGALSRDIGTLDWREVTADIKKNHIEPLKKAARDFIISSRFEVEGLHLDREGFLETIGHLDDEIMDGLRSVLTKAVTEDNGGKYLAPWVTTRAKKDAVEALALKEHGSKTKAWEAEEAHGLLERRGLAPSAKPTKRYAKDW